MPVIDLDDLLARTDEWLENTPAMVHAGTVQLVERLRAALAAQPQPDERDAEIERLKWMVSEARRLGVVFKLRGAYLKAGSATPTGDDDGEAFTRILTEWFDSPGADHDKWNHEKWEADDE